MHPLLNVLQQIRQGGLLDELHEAVEAAIAAEQKTGRGAEVTLKIQIQPAAQGDSLPVFIGATVATKLPAVDHGKTIFFVTGDDALLSRRDPRQEELFALKTVGRADVNTETGEILSNG